MNISSYILSKRYTDDSIAETRQYVEDTAVGAGAIKGAPCEIQSIEVVEGGNNVTFLWHANDGTTRTQSIFIKNGTDGTDGDPGKQGIGIVKIEQTPVSEENPTESLLTIHLSDGTTQTFTINSVQGLPGTPGSNGVTPDIGENGHWFIDGVDTGVIAAPDLNGYYNEDNFIPLTNEEIDQLCAEEA